MAEIHYRGAYGVSGKEVLPIVEELTQLVAALTSLHDLELLLLPQLTIDIASANSAATWRGLMVTWERHVEPI